MKDYQIPHTDLTVSRIAYGCAGLAPWDQNAINALDRKRAERLVLSACEQGINLFDHADIYAFGKCETVFGEVLKASPGLREKLVIQSKCGQVFSPDFSWGRPIFVNLTRKHIVHSIEGSLKRLGTDYLDIALLHAPSTLVRPPEVAEAFEELHRSGKVRYFGVSNYTAAQIELLKVSVCQPLVVNQIHVGLAYADPLVDGVEFAVLLARGDLDSQRHAGVAGAGTVDYCRLRNIQIQAWSPVRSNLLAPTAESPPWMKVASEKMRSLAATKQITPAALALGGLLHLPARILPVTGAGTVEHFIEYCTADRAVLSDEEWYDLLAIVADIETRTQKTKKKKGC